MFAVLDTNHLREYTHATELGVRLQARIAEEKPEVFACVVVAEEALSGWIAFTRKHRAGLHQLNGYARLHACIETLSKLTLLPFDHEVALIFHELVRAHPRTGTMDLKIAAICLAHDATLLSRNLVDFQDIHSLRVENWLD